MPEHYAPFPVDHPLITVPKDGELASNASLVGFKELADITKLLKDDLAGDQIMLDAHQALLAGLADAAHKNQENTFTQRQLITLADAATTPALEFSVKRADVPLLTSTRPPSDHGGGNMWKLLGRFKRAGSTYCYLYIGSETSGAGAIAFVINAWWDPDAQLWNRDGAGAALAFVLRDATVIVRRKDDGTGATWNNAGWDYGSVAAEEYTYRAGVGLPQRRVQVSLATASNYGTDTGATLWGSQIIIPPNGVVLLPLLPPHGSQLGNCRVKVKSGHDTNLIDCQLDAYRAKGIHMTDSSVPTVEGGLPGWSHRVYGAGSANVSTCSVTFDVPVKNLYDASGANAEQYWLQIWNRHGTDNARIVAADMAFTDPGPRNF